MSCPHCLLACWLMTATPQWLANKDWFSMRLRFVCWCMSMSLHVCEWCTLSHYAVLARTSPKKFSPMVLYDYKKGLVQRVFMGAPHAHRLSRPPQPQPHVLPTFIGLPTFRPPNGVPTPVRPFRVVSRFEWHYAVTPLPANAPCCRLFPAATYRFFGFPPWEAAGRFWPVLPGACCFTGDFAFVCFFFSEICFISPRTWATGVFWWP